MATFVPPPPAGLPMPPPPGIDSDEDELQQLQQQYDNENDNDNDPPPPAVMQDIQNANDDYNPFDDDNDYYYDDDNTNNQMPQPPPPIPVIDNSITATTPDYSASTNSNNNNVAIPPPPMSSMDDNTQSSAPAPQLTRSPGTVPPPPRNISSMKILPPAPPSNSHKPKTKRQPTVPTSPPNNNPPPPPAFSATKSANDVFGLGTPPPPKRERSGARKQIPPKMLSGHIVSKSLAKDINLGKHNDNDNKQPTEPIDQVSFTDILRQVDVGIEMTDRLKEVIRKFCKHQQTGADKLQEIYAKLPSTYQANDGMKQFADLCALVHTLILETVSAQKRMADFLHKDVVPKMDTYIKEKQQQLQHLKRDNHQAEMKLKNSVNTMNKASHTAKNSAIKAKQAVIPKKRRNTRDKNNKKGKTFGSKFKTMTKKLGSKKDDYSDLPEEEQMYMRAANYQKNYEATVMAANYEQETYFNIQSRFKRDCRGLEHQRMQYCSDKITQFITAHRQYFQNEKILVLQTRILSSMDNLNQQTEYNNYLDNIVATKGKHIKPSSFQMKKFDYQNVFHSLQDSMDITNKLAPHAKLPLMLTTLCNKVRELNGFDTEGIFRKSPMATEIDRIKAKLSKNDYILDTQDPHVAAGLLKDWLRGLKDSLIPQSHYDMAIDMAKKGKIKTETLEVFLSQLPEVNRDTIKYLVKFLKDLIEPAHISHTKMNLENVAIVFAPTILKCPHKDMNVLLANSRHEKTFTVLLMEQLNCTNY